MEIHRWIPLTKAGEAELWCFLWSVPEQMVEQTIETPVIWRNGVESVSMTWRHPGSRSDGGM